jgi:hypothetical protein
MIYARLFDGGTELRTQPSDVPGLWRGWWTDVRAYEESVFDYRLRTNTEEQNAAMEKRTTLTTDRVLHAWPNLFPGHSWIDWTTRYRDTSLDGFRLELSYPERFIGGQEFPGIPAGELSFRPDQTPSPDTVREEGRLIRERSWRETRELQAELGNPETFVRLDTLNESGGCQLKEPIALRARGNRGSVVLTLPDQSLFDPFDLRYPDRYLVIDENGSELGRDFAYLNPRGFYNLHFRPRRWKFYVVVYCIFWHITFFEIYPVREVFTQAWYDRPPTYPYRHNLHNFNIFSIDNAVLWQFEHSQAAADLSRQIFEAQYWTLSVAHIFGGVELCQMWIERAAPRRGETVFVLERVDRAIGRSYPVFVKNKASDATLENLYPTTDIAFFQEVPWTPTGSDNWGVGGIY